MEMSGPQWTLESTTDNGLDAIEAAMKLAIFFLILSFSLFKLLEFE